VFLSAFTGDFAAEGGWFSLTEIALDGDIPPSIPEPSTLSLLGAGLAGLGIIRRRRKVA
jgi:hypothetical protein